MVLSIVTIYASLALVLAASIFIFVGPRCPSCGHFAASHNVRYPCGERTEVEIKSIWNYTNCRCTLDPSEVWLNWRKGFRYCADRDSEA